MHEQRKPLLVNEHHRSRTRLLHLDSANSRNWEAEFAQSAEAWTSGSLWAWWIVCPSILRDRKLSADFDSSVCIITLLRLVLVHDAANDGEVTSMASLDPISSVR